MNSNVIPTTEVCSCSSALWPPGGADRPCVTLCVCPPRGVKLVMLPSADFKEQQIISGVICLSQVHPNKLKSFTKRSNTTRNRPPSTAELMSQKWDGSTKSVTNTAILQTVIKKKFWQLITELIMSNICKTSRYTVKMMRNLWVTVTCRVTF